MKVLAVLSCVVVCAWAKPGYLDGPALAAPDIAYSDLAIAPVAVGPMTSVAVSPAVSVGIRTQYHAQDKLGQASYGHAEPLQIHNAVQDVFGNKIGSYSYVSPDGQLIKTYYVADAAGVRIASNALPVGPLSTVGPEETAEVVAARTAHLAEVETVKSRSKRGLFALNGPANTARLSVATVRVAPASAVHTATAFTYAASPVVHATPIASLSSTAPTAAPVANVATDAPTPSHVTYTADPVAAPMATVADANPFIYAAHVDYTATTIPVVRKPTLTTVVYNPGYAISYRVD